jgi:hypothetical protein
MSGQESVRYTGFINAFELDQKQISREKYLAKVRAARSTGISFEGPQVEGYSSRTHLKEDGA